MEDMIRIPIQDAEKLSMQILTSNGFNQKHATAITRNIVTAQRDECHSHGLYRLIACVQTVRNDGVDPNAEPELIDQAPSIVKVDAHQGSSLLAFELGMPRLVDKAKETGLAALAINNSFHFSALWPEVEALSGKGLAALAMTTSHAYVAPAGGKSPLFGTNPIAFSWPRPGDTPYTFDFATSVVARGEVELFRRSGKNLPEGWALDDAGQPTTDPAVALSGALLPFGGYKGSALSTMIELLAGPLIGDLFGHETQAADKNQSGKPFHGEIILALAPERFLGKDAQAHLDHAETLFDSIIGQGARLPSQRRYEARKRSLAEGILIAKPLYDELRELAAHSA